MKRKILFFLTGFSIITALIAMILCNLFCKSSEYKGDIPLIVQKDLRCLDLSKLLVDEKVCNNIVLSSCTLQMLNFLNINIKYGEYLLPKRVSFIDAIKIIISGKVLTRKITFPEGFTSVDVVNRINSNQFLLGEITAPPIEGSIMPDTYCFKYPTTKQQIIEMAQASMAHFLNTEWEKRSSTCVVKTPEEALILASIIEKETHNEHELIAGVYSKRLKMNMKLQADPTTIYAHTRGAKLSKPLLRSDLKIKDPYNTYLNKGLPPTPIANPSRVSVKAVLHPTDTDCLFFVYDKISKHIFSKTFNEHKNNIKQIKDRQKHLQH